MLEPHEKSTASAADSELAEKKIDQLRQAMPQGKKLGQRKQLTPGDMTLRNIIWALALTVGVVVIAAVIGFGVGREHSTVTPETSQMDVNATAERAEAAADFPVAVPALGEDWIVRDARYSGSGEASWVIRYTSPSSALVTLTESKGESAALLSRALPGTLVESETEVAGAQCRVVTEGAADDDGEPARGLTCTGDGWSLIAHGGTSDEELAEVMTAAIESLQN